MADPLLLAEHRARFTRSEGAVSSCHRYQEGWYLHHRGAITLRLMQRSQDEIARAIAQPVRYCSLAPMKAPSTPFAGSEQPVMHKRRLIDHHRSPASCDCLSDIDGVPAERPFEWRQRGEALGSVGAALRFDEDAFRPVAVPSAGSLVDANAACDSEHWIGDELARNPFEVIGLEGHIGVDLEPDVGAARQPSSSSFEQGRNSSAACGSRGRILQ